MKELLEFLHKEMLDMMKVATYPYQGIRVFLTLTVKATPQATIQKEI